MSTVPTDPPPPHSERIRRWVEAWATIEAYIAVVCPIPDADLLQVIGSIIEDLAYEFDLTLRPCTLDLASLPSDDEHQAARCEAVFYWFDQWPDLIPEVWRCVPDCDPQWMERTTSTLAMLGDLARMSAECEQAQREVLVLEAKGRKAEEAHRRALVRRDAICMEILRSRAAAALGRDASLPFPPTA